MPNEFVIKHGFISKGDSIVNGTISGETLNLSTITGPSNSLTQVLVRNDTTGVVEYRDASSLSGSPSTDIFVTGGTFSSGTLILDRQNGPVTVTGFPSSILVNETVYVDALNGNDSTGVRGDMGLPYLTISGANQTAITGDTVHVRPGIYQECDILTDGIAYYFDNGSIVHPTDAQQTIIGTAILDASGYTYPIVILGYGEFISDFSANIGGQEVGVGNFNTDSVHCQFLKATWTNGNSQGGPKGVFWLFHTGPDDTSIRIIGGTITKNNDTGGASHNCIYVYGGKNIFIDATLINTNTTGGGSAIYLNAGIDTTLIGHGDIFVSASTATCYGIRHSNNTNYLSWDGKIEIGEQLNGYAIYLETSGGGEFRYSGYFLGAIYLSAGGLNNKGVYLNGIQQCTASPNNYAITATNDGNYVIDLNISSSVTGIFYMKDDGSGSIPSVIFQGAIAPSAFSSRLMTVETGKFVWNGIIEDANKRFENSVITGGEVVVQSDLELWGQTSPSNVYVFYVNGGTLRVEGCKIENHQAGVGCGVIEMTNNVNNTLILNGATLIAEQNDPTAYSVKTPTTGSLDVQIYGDSYSNRHIGPGTLNNIVPNGGFLYNLTACTTVYKYCDLNISGKTTTTNFQMTSGATDGYILTSDAVGDASWQSSSDTNIFVTGTTFSSNQSTTTRNDGVDVLKLSGGTNVTLSNPSGNQINIDVSSSSSIDTGNVLWVDNVFGNDGTALVDRQDRPWSSIATAISNVSINDTIMVRPGDYIEPSFTLVPGTSLVSQGGAKVTFISASTPTGNFIIISGSSYMEGFTVYTPTDDSAALYFNDSTPGIVTSFHNVHFKGSSTVSPPLGKGIVLDNNVNWPPPGPGKIIFSELRYAGGNLDKLVEVNKGIFALDGMHVPGGGTINTAVQVNGGRAQMINVNNGNSACGIALSISGTSSNKPTVAGFGFNIFNVPIGIEITSNDYDVEIQSGRLDAGTTNLLITSGLTGSNGKLNLTGFVMDSTKLSVPNTWVDSNHIFTYSDLGEAQNLSPIYRSWSNFEVGHANKGFDTNLGRGSEYQNGMHIHTSGTSNTTNVSVSAKTEGTTWTFESLTSGTQIYIGSDQKYSNGEYLNFNAFNITYIGSTGGTYTIEFYSGGTWMDIKYQCVHHELGHNYGNTLFGRTVASDEVIRFGMDEEFTWDSTSISGLGGHIAKWIRITMVTPPASLPQFDLIWLDPSHTEINKNGIINFYGNALYKEPLTLSSFGAGGGTTDGTVPVGSGGAPTGWNHVIQDAKFNAASDEIFLQAPIPRGVCTAYPLKVVIYFGLETSDSGVGFTVSPQFTVSFLPRGANNTLVADPAGGIVPTPRTIENTQTLGSDPADFTTLDMVETGKPLNTYFGKPLSVSHDKFYIDDWYEGDGFLIRITIVNGTPSQFTGNNGITLLAVEVNATKWSLGERLRIE